ncbi:hypothetical protein [Streptomyces sp. UNOB3_S3]|uniref:hypothetical protein n=1 Tax=Streptomyces sp. UNOB3_S3 TaxID=2871682 RepID=UPI001E32ACD4|nr:hypothetical protein [Streptomyces sp. UNOB3_S3]MCC3777834.1 hypothetical protein [Streptomyces sp. UNOB3_S3]
MPNFAGTAVPNLPPLPERERPTLQMKLQQRYSLVASNEPPRNEVETDESPGGDS